MFIRQFYLCGLGIEEICLREIRWWKGKAGQDLAKYNNPKNALVYNKTLI
jgi:hypothetical protein